MTPVGGATGSTGVEPGADSRMLPADALEAPVDAHETPAGLHMRPMDARTLPTDKCGLSGGAIGHMHGVPSGGSEGGERQQDGGLTEAQRQRIAANRARALARRNARISGTRSGAEEPPSRLALAGAGLGQAPSRTEPSTQGVTADATADSQRLLSTQAAPASLTVPCLGSPRIGTHAQDGVERAAMGRAALASTVAPALHGGGTVPVVDPNVTLNDAGGSHSLGTDVHHEERVTGPGAEASVDEQRAREVELSRVDGQLEVTLVHW